MQSLARLKTTYIDVLILNRPDPSIPIATIMETFKAFVSEGLVKYVGLSEATPAEIRAAHAVLPLTAIEQEYSLNTRDIEGELLSTIRELGIGLLAYSPLGRGLLGSTIKSRADLKPGDWRLSSPRFSEENIAANVKKAEKLADIAASKGCTSAQLALAWLLAQGLDVFPVQGSTKVDRTRENLGAINVVLTPEEAESIAALVPEADGDRYTGMFATWNKRK